MILSGRSASISSQFCTFKIKSLRCSEMIFPLRDSKMQTFTTYDPSGGAIPLMMPVAALMVTLAPKGLVPL